jgi:hypothetical protein
MTRQLSLKTYLLKCEKALEKEALGGSPIFFNEICQSEYQMSEEKAF